MKPSHLKKLGKSAEKIGDVYTAIEYYEAYAQKKPNDYETILKLADAYRKSRNYQKAADFYKKVFEGDSRTFFIAGFYHGQMLMMQGKYEMALTVFEDFKRKARGIYDRKWLKNMMDACEMIIKEGELPGKQLAETYHLEGVNKPHIELSPMFLDDSLMVYASLKLDTLPYFSNIYHDEEKPTRKFYQARKLTDTLWKDIGEWNELFNIPNAHTGNGVMSMDGKRFYFSRCKNDWNNKVNCQLYLSSKENGNWSTPRKMNDDINLLGYTATQPALGIEPRRNKEVIYFVSNRPRGRGGLDIWYTVYDHHDSTYSKARNAGTRINTGGDEVTPFYNLMNRTLYFSSNYWPGYGGFDVFRTRGDQGRWGKNKNMGNSINSPADDLYFTINSKNRTKGMLVSNREGSVALLHSTCCDDLYGFELSDYLQLTFTGKIFQSELKPDSLFFQSDVITSLLKDTTSNSDMIVDSTLSSMIENTKRQDVTRSDDKEKLDILPGAMVTVYLLDPEDPEPIFIFNDTVDNEGKYSIVLEPGEDYKLVFSKDQYFNKNFEISTKPYTETKEIELDDVALEPIPREPIQFNIYYEFDKARLTEDSKILIDTTLLPVLQETPDLIVEISSHTDSKGDSIYNKDLSQKRAESVVEYLVNKGIDKGRLIAKGYGEDKPIASNDTGEGRAKNRRSEFRVIGSIDQFSRLNASDLIITKPHPNREKIINNPRK